MASANEKRITLHQEILTILAANDNRWMTTAEIATSVNKRRRYRKKDGSIVNAYQIHGRTRQYGHIFEKDGSQVRVSMPVGPLPYSAFPERLSDPVGRLAVAFAGIEGRVSELLAELTGDQPDDQTISQQLSAIEEAAVTAITQEAERDRLTILVSNIRNVSRYRNAIMRSTSRSSEKGVGQTALYSAMRNENVRIDAESLAALTGWMHCILDALDRRRYGAANWQVALAKHQPKFDLELQG
jgi:hypothetical protein